MAQNRHHGAWEEGAPVSSDCATSASSCSRGPSGPGGPAQPQRSPARACSAQVSPARLYPCGPRILPGRKGPPLSAPAHKSFALSKAQAIDPPGEIFPSYSPLSWPHEVLILWVPTTALLGAYENLITVHFGYLVGACYSQPPSGHQLPKGREQV